MTSVLLRPNRSPKRSAPPPAGQPQRASRRSLPQRLWPAVFTVVSLGLLWGLWIATARPVAVTVDGQAATVYTHRHTVGALLTDLGLTLQPADHITPNLQSSLSGQGRVTIELARPLRILADGRDLVMGSWATTPRQLLAEAMIPVDAYDQVVVDGVNMQLDDPLPPPRITIVPTTFDRGYSWASRTVTPLQLRVRRAIPLLVDEGSLPYTIRTTAQTVGEALRQAQLTLYLGDKVQPSLGSLVTAGLRITIQRSIPIHLQVDGRTLKTRTQATSVADALTALSIGVIGQDEVQPALNTKLYPDIEIKITRVHEDVELSEETTSFETVFTADANLPIDTQQEIAPGAEGITRERARVRYADGVEITRTVEDRWLAQEPAQRVIAYGQQITPQTATMPDGSNITYWRKIRMSASSYSAGTAGVAPSNPNYGRTFTGELMRTGIVAVDPRIIPLHSKIYVPGYGPGEALDIGSAIQARRIDLGYSDDELVLWSKWVDVYLLWPPPPAYQITWVIPNFPRVPN